MMPIIEVVDRVVLVRYRIKITPGKPIGTENMMMKGIHERLKLRGHDHVDQDQGQDAGKHAGPGTFLAAAGFARLDGC